MGRKAIILCTLACLTWAGACFATVLDSNNLLILTGGSFSADQGVTIKGNMGVGTSAYLAKCATVTGNVFSGGQFSIDQKGTIGGDVVAGGDIWISKQSKLGGVQGWGSVGLDQQVIVNGDLLAAKGMTISKSSAIHGDVEYGTTYWADSGVKIDGHLQKDMSDLDTWAPPTVKSPTAWTFGSNNVHFGAKTDKALTPGTYGSVSIGSCSILRLSAGTYNFSSLLLAQSTKLLADTSAGDVIINILDGMSTGKSAILDAGDTNDLVINSNKSIYLGQGTKADADLLSFNGSIQIDRDSSVMGYMYAQGDMWLGSGVTVESLQALPLNNSVPEPTTILMLLVGGMLATRKRH